MTDTKAIEKALRELERVRDIVIHMPQPGNWDIVVNTLVEDIDKLIPSATTALAALLAEREEKRAEIDKLRTALKAATDYDEAAKAFVYLCSCPTIGQPAGTRLAHEAQLFRAARAKASA